MLPSEWQTLYGKANFRTELVTAANPLRIPADDDRYVLMVFVGGNTGHIRPNTNDGTTPTHHVMQPGDGPFALVHTLHGPLVNLSWVILTPGPDLSVTVFECQAKPVKAIKRFRDKDTVYVSGIR